MHVLGVGKVALIYFGVNCTFLQETKIKSHQ